jgi:LysM repeat protein
MALKEKYQDLVNLASKLGIRNLEVKEEGGKLVIKGTTTYQLEKDLFWDKIKQYPDWQKDLSADIRAERTDIHGIYTVQPGDTLSKLAKVHLDDVKRYMEIFNANKDQLKDPNLIKVGQKLVIPKR